MFRSINITSLMQNSPHCINKDLQSGSCSSPRVPAQRDWVGRVYKVDET